MKRILLLTLTLICVAGVASADVGHIGIFADEAGTDCDVQDLAYVVATFYVLHYNATSANTSQFAVTWDASITATPLSQSPNPAYLTLGTFTTGITITYVGCKTSFPLTLGTLTFFGQGTTPGCARVRVIPDPFLESGKVEVVDCSAIVHTVDNSLDAFFSTSGDCGCSVATEETNWSRIKALYQ
jgi:hypothetical protein